MHAHCGNTPKYILTWHPFTDSKYFATPVIKQMQRKAEASLKQVTSAKNKHSQIIGRKHIHAQFFLVAPDR
jgi:hypothetical protein